MSSDFIPTRGSKEINPQSINYVSVKYEGHKRKARDSTIRTKTAPITEDVQKEFNVRKAKHEIIKFGISGLDAQKKEEAKVQLLIKLGAKPPKNKNYKQLIAKRKKEKMVHKTNQQFQQLGNNSLAKSLGKVMRGNVGKTIPLPYSICIIIETLLVGDRYRPQHCNDWSQYCNGAHEVFKECGTACPPTCGQTQYLGCPAVCISGCFCEDGFLKNSNGQCVRLQNCN